MTIVLSRVAVRQNCSLDLCEHGANCTDTDMGYVCDCAPGYIGDLCERGMSYRDILPKVVKRKTNVSSIASIIRCDPWNYGPAVRLTFSHSILVVFS